jgi:lysyl-tRNA synthetase class 2
MCTHDAHIALILRAKWWRCSNLPKQNAPAMTKNCPVMEVTVAGRIRRLNVKGKVSFMHIEDEHGRVQLFLRINNMGEDAYGMVRDKLVEVDDFVQAQGIVMRTRTGEPSVQVAELTLLAKSLSPLPVVKQQTLEDGTVREFGEFSDVETRYRQRYADLAVNTDVRDVFRKRAAILRAMRQFLDDEGMLEVETPILQPIYGGAAARPFTTHHNQLKQDLFLRISFELYLKRLLVGGYDAVYEIGRDFRNEGVSIKHNPEFTMMEFYKAYIDYHGVMDIVERMTAFIAETVLGTTEIEYQGKVINLAPAWERLTIRDSVKKYHDIDIMDYPTADAMRQLLQERFNEKTKPNEPWGRLVVEHLFGNHVEPLLIQPTFIMDYPRDVSPFAKRTEYDENFVERFEISSQAWKLVMPSPNSTTPATKKHASWRWRNFTSKAMMTKHPSMKITCVLCVMVCHQWVALAWA